MMQFRTLTVQQLRRRVLSLTHRDSYVSGTVLTNPVPTNTTFALTSAKKFPDNTFEGKIAYATAGTGVGQSVYVDQSAVGTGVLTVTPSVSPVFDGTTIVEIIPDEINPDAVMDQINLALESILDMVNIYEEVSSPVIPDTERRTVTIPAEMVKLCVFKYRDAGGLWRICRPRFNAECPGQEQGFDFTVQGRTIYLSEALSSDILGPSMFVTGYRFPNVVDTDDDVVEAPVAYMVFRVAALLEQSLIAGTENDPDSHATRAATWATQAEVERSKGQFTNWLPGTIPLLV